MPPSYSNSFVTVTEPHLLPLNFHHFADLRFGAHANGQPKALRQAAPSRSGRRPGKLHHIRHISYVGNPTNAVGVGT
jgi:hypothetical protein